MGFWKSLGKAADTTYSTTMTIAEAIQDWIKNHPKEAKAIEGLGATITSDVLKEEKYRNIRFDAGMAPGLTSVKVFNGQFCETVGEYNDAVDKWHSENYML